MEELQRARNTFIEGMSRISSYWGFPKAMGAIYGAIYLAPQPISLDELVEQVGVSKGAVSTSVRGLERLGLVHKHFQLHDRKDYYVAEADFWRVVKSILKEREKSEFARALNAVTESFNLANEAAQPEEAELAVFYQKRLGAIKSFFDSLDSLVATLITLDELRLSTIQKLFNR